MSVLALISGHGFGHWTRSEAVLERLARSVPVHVRTDRRAAILARRATWPTTCDTPWNLGPGVVQEGPLRVDRAATLDAWREHVAGWDATLRDALHQARELDTRLVYADVPPLGLALGRALGVPTLAVANFSWSWLLEPFAEDDAAFGAIVEHLRAAESGATHLVALPGGGGLAALGPPTLEALLRRPPTCDPAQARALLHEHVRNAGVDRAGRPVVLLSFGGFGDGLDLSQGAGREPGYVFLTFAEPLRSPPNLVSLPHDHGLPFQDLVLGADAVLTKPGYGILSECLAAPTPVVWCEPNPDFREHSRLVAGLLPWLPNAPISSADLHAGRWSKALEHALTATPLREGPPQGLAEVVALIEGLWARQ
jgi:hypothetical protein